jgi:recombination protein RecA
MTTLSSDVTSALASLQARWGAAAPQRLGRGTGELLAAGSGEVGAVVGALATVPLPGSAPFALGPKPDPGRVLSTGFAALDAILGPGGLPRPASVALRGAASSGTTTVALRIAAEAQAAGLIVAWLDCNRSFDPVEAFSRGVAPDWLVVVTPATLDEGLSIAGSLLAGRSVDVLVVDLPTRLDRPVADRLGRLSALARRAGSLFVAIEPPGLEAGLAGAVAAAVGLRLELARRSWIHLGRDIVGQRTVVTIGRNRYGVPGRSAELRILYAEGGDRDACLLREDLLRDALPEGRLPVVAHLASVRGIGTHASPSPLLAQSAPGSRGAPLRLVPAGSGRDRRTSVDERHRPRREPGRARAGRPARNGAGVGPPARP